MRIVQAVGWYFPDSIGGTETYVHALARRLRACGHDVLIAAPQAGGRAPRTYRHDGAQIFRYPIPLRATRNEAQGRRPVAGSQHFHKWLADTRADVVHIHTFITGLGLDEIAAAREAGSRVVATTHASALGFLCQRGTLMWRGETMCDGRLEIRRCASCELEHRGAHRQLADVVAGTPLAVSRAVGWMPGPAATAVGLPALIDWNRERQRRMLSLVDRFVVLTDRAAAIVLDNGAPADKVSVNRLGVSQLFTPRSQAARRLGQPLRIGYVGRFDPVKGVLDLASALRMLPPDLPLQIEYCGPTNTPADRRTRDLVARMTASDRRVSLRDPVALESIPQLMQSYDLVCCPSRTLEGGPTSGLEAMAAGTPVVAADVGGVAELIVNNENGRLVPVGDVGALAAALEDLVRRPEQIDAWRDRLPPIRTMNDVAADYLDLYAKGR